MLWVHIISWLGLVILAIINGAIRDKRYRQVLGDLRAHQVSTVTFLVLISVFVWLLARFWPLDSAGKAMSVGGIWLVLTLLFEFGFGHVIWKRPWKALFHDYNIVKGRIWVLILIWTFLAPLVFHQL